MTMFRTLLLTLAIVITATTHTAYAKGSSSGKSYGGGTHTGSHKGTYAGGSGSSHKGGAYVSPSGSNNYGKHKK
jgi:hypothetical protein